MSLIDFSIIHQLSLCLCRIYNNHQRSKSQYNCLSQKNLINFVFLKLSSSSTVLIYQTNSLLLDKFHIDYSSTLENMFHFFLRHLHKILLVNEDKHHHQLIPERNIEHNKFFLITIHPSHPS